MGEHWYGGIFSGSEEYKVGDTVYLRYDPNDPDTNDLVTKERRKQLLVWVIAGALIVWGLTVFISSLAGH